MLTDKTNRIAEMIQKNRGKERPQDRRVFTLPENSDNQKNNHKQSNIDMILPLVLNARDLGLDGFQASLLLTLANLIVATEIRPSPPNLKELANKIGCGTSTLERHISQLKELGFIEIDKTLDDRGYSRNIYRFNGLQDKLQVIGIDV